MNEGVSSLENHGVYHLEWSGVACGHYSRGSEDICCVERSNDGAYGEARFQADFLERAKFHVAGEVLRQRRSPADQRERFAVLIGWSGGARL